MPKIESAVPGTHVRVCKLQVLSLLLDGINDEKSGAVYHTVLYVYQCVVW